MADASPDQSPDASRRLLVISQVYPPEPAAVGQYMAEVAEAMAARGHTVTALATDRGFDDPTLKFEKQPTRHGVRVVRMPWSHFGKRSIFVRLVGSLAFVIQAILRGLLMKRPDAILVSTSPPIASMAALTLSSLRRLPICFWSMDINPEQAVAMGKASPGSLPVKLFDALNKKLLRKAARVVTLDDYMAKTLENKTPKHPLDDRLSVIPTWPHEVMDEPIAHDQNPFRTEHVRDLPAGGRVIMYSGNMSIAHPMQTLIDAALELRDEARLKFMFIGGGLGKQQVDAAIAQHAPANMHSLPYQPLEQLKYSLSAADVHLVAMGEAMVGIVHPCKIYNAMACGRPILAVAPPGCHVADLIDQYRCGWRVREGDTQAMVDVLREIAETPQQELAAMGHRAMAGIRQDLDKAKLLGRFCDELSELMQD